MVTRPRLLFLGFKYGQDVPSFIRRHREEHIRCLGHWFDVRVVAEDCDYQQVCELHQPDLAIFESGVNQTLCQRPRISNLRGCDHVPRVALLNADGWSETRSGIISDIDEWQVEALFSIAITAAEHTPALADQLFTWPNFVDPKVFHDYGDSRIVPLIITGSQDPQYPWRNKVYRLLSKQFPSIVSPHAGYASRGATKQMPYGEAYARLISSALLGPACGSVAKEVVRKHFEIPACRTCLIAERSPGLESAGFVDMQNCVFADEQDVIEKVAYLLANSEELRAISDAGYELVHSRHTSEQRDQIYQWSVLRKELNPGERIVQADPFGSVAIARAESVTRSVHVISDGLHLQLMDEGDQRFERGEYDKARQCYMRCSNYMAMLPEAKLKLAICSLCEGHARRAHRQIIELVRYTLNRYRACDPDPIEWAYLIVALLCMGRVRAARAHAARFSDLRNIELDRVRRLVHVLTEGASRDLWRDIHPEVSRRSVHRIPLRDIADWIGGITRMLKACGQTTLADSLAAAASSSTSAGPPVSGRPPFARNIFANVFRRADRRSGRLRLLLLLAKVRRRMIAVGLGVLHVLEKRWGYFLPYSHSAMRDDDWLREVWTWARQDSINSALLICATNKTPSTRAFLSGLAANQNRPAVLSLSRHDMAIRQTAPSETFDAVLVTALPGSSTSIGLVERVIRRAQVVLLDAIHTEWNYDVFQRMLVDPHYDLIRHDLTAHEGWAIFQRR
jgi:hypothetical protein